MPNGDGGLFQGYEITYTNLQNVPGLKERVRRELGIPDWVDISLQRLVKGWGERLVRPEEDKEELPLTAELLSMDPSDPRHMGQLILDNSLATMSAKLAENPELLNQEGMWEQWMNLAMVEQGMATDPQAAAAATTALGLGYQEAFTAGEFDTPEKAEEAAQTFAQQMQALTGLEEAVAAEEVSPEDELTALYEQQVKEQAELEQMGFYRAGIMDLVSLAPPEARLGLMAGMLENPEIAKMFFPKPPEQPKPWSPETPTGGLPSESKFVIE